MICCILLCRRHLHHKSRKYSLQEGARGGGEESGPGAASGSPDSEELGEVDRVDLLSHRIEDTRGVRRHLIQPRVR